VVVKISKSRQGSSRPLGVKKGLIEKWKRAGKYS
jgi:hypothetical protein